MKKKRICIIHKVETFNHRSFHKIAKSFKKRFIVTIIGLYKNHSTKEDIKVIGITRANSRLKKFLFTNLSVFNSALKEKANIYYFHDVDFIPFAVLLKLFTKSIVIYNRHEAYPEYMLLKQYIPKPLRYFLYYFVYLTEFVSVKFFDAIVSNDNYIVNDYKHKRNIAVFNFPTLEFFNSSEEIPWQDRRYDLFYHGSLPRYHFETMLKIAEGLNKRGIKNRWGIIMSKHSPRQWAEEETKKRGLEHNFEFLPYTDYLNIHKYLLQARVGIIPLPPFKKFMKNIPLKLFEFMGSGLPVVLSDLPPSRQFIEGQDCAIAVEPDNIDEYVDAIEFLLKNPDRAMEMGENGKRLVFTKYNWSFEEKKLFDLIDELENKNG